MESDGAVRRSKKEEGGRKVRLALPIQTFESGPTRSVPFAEPNGLTSQLTEQMGEGLV